MQGCSCKLCSVLQPTPLTGGKCSIKQQCFYDKIDDKWIVWLFKETLGIVCMEDNDGELSWIQCENKEVENVDRHIAAKREEMSSSPVGFYGLYNPQLNEFCLRDIRTPLSLTDLRKITIGRRCTDWDQKTLLDLAIRKMKIDPPADFMDDIDLEDYDRLSHRVKKSKHSKLPDDVQNLDVMRRFLYWIRTAPRITWCWRSRCSTWRSKFVADN